VLYLFVLMLLNLKGSETITHKRSWVPIFFVLVILGEILLVLLQPSIPQQAGPVITTLGNTQAVGMALFSDYLLPFEMIGIILLGGAIGALVLAKQIPSR